ncbi:MAG: hypothetical protein WD696_02440 [Bryobacteraceae bacterium]
MESVIIGVMRLCILALFCLPALASDAIEAFDLRWQVPIRADWKIENRVLHLLKARPSLKPRRPGQFALAQTPDYMQVTVEAEMKKEPAALRNRRTSLLIVYAYRDANHFNYAHLSVDSAEEAEHHNGIFHVAGGDRVRISPRQGPGTLREDQWHKVRLTYDGRSGKVAVFVDGETSPSLQAVEKTLGAGRVGIGSFFDLGQFRNVKISGETLLGLPLARQP